MEFKGMEANPAHPPATKSECLLDMDTFQFGEFENLLLLNPPDSVHLSDWSSPDSLSRLFSKLHFFWILCIPPFSSVTSTVQSSLFSVSGGALSWACRKSLSPEPE